jgi:polysaccharide deacetylase 2 family uncharacterized protein YibQ
MKNKVLLLLPILLVLFQISVSAENVGQKELKAAIIIDDFGGGAGGVQDFLEGNVPITAAVMPFTEKSKEHAEWAHKNGLDVMVHLPMEPKKGKRSWLGPKPITVDLTPEEVRQRVLEAIQSVPYAIGLNNHMGSLAVENEKIVRAIVEVAKERKLFIIDSGTSMGTKFPEIAKELGVPIMKRDVFLDDISSATHVKKQMIRLAKVTEIKGTGIGIGHVGIKGKACSTGVYESIAEFNKRNIKIVPISELIHEKKADNIFSPH